MAPMQVNRILAVGMLLMVSALSASAAKKSEPDFTIEDRRMRVVPAAVEAAVRQGGGEATGCALEGVTVDLRGIGQKADYAVTTADACNWGAAVGPIWLVLSQSSGFRLVLASDGYGLFFKKAGASKPRDVVVFSATAARYSETPWGFRGQSYVQLKPTKTTFLLK